MGYRIEGLDAGAFEAMHNLPETALARLGAMRMRVEAHPGAPCRVSLDDAGAGESVLLLPFEHQPAATPYRQQGPIFVRAGVERWRGENTLPPALARRLLSLRAFDAADMMIDADVADGANAEELIERLFGRRETAYIHAHYARRGCFAARIDRV